MIDDEEIMDDVKADIRKVCSEAQLFIALEAEPIRTICAWFGKHFNITVIASNGVRHNFRTEEPMAITSDDVAAALRCVGIDNNSKWIPEVQIFGWVLTFDDLDKLMR